MLEKQDNDINDLIMRANNGEAMNGIRVDAILKLGWLESGAKNAVSSLIALVKNECVADDIRVEAIRSLSRIGKDVTEFVPILIQAVKNATPKVGPCHGITAIFVLGELRDVTGLIQLMNDKSVKDNIRAHVIRELGDLEDHAKPAASSLINVIGDTGTADNIRIEAIAALPFIRISGKDAETAVTILNKVIENPDTPKEIKTRAIDVSKYLVTLTEKAEVRSLIEIVKNPNAIPELRSAMIRRLAKMENSEAKDTVKQFLIQLLRAFSACGLSDLDLSEYRSGLLFENLRNLRKLEPDIDFHPFDLN